MKAKVILYGWALSWLFLFAGIGTMEHGSILAGSLLCSVWFFFSYMLIGNEAACLWTVSKNGWFGCLVAATRINNRFRSQLRLVLV